MDSAKNDPIIVDIKCGYYHNVICTKDKTYYLFGYNKYNQCLVEGNHKMFVKIPAKFDIEASGLKGYKILDIYPGYHETRIVTVKLTQD